MEYFLAIAGFVLLIFIESKTHIIKTLWDIFMK